MSKMRQTMSKTRTITRKALTKKLGTFIKVENAPARCGYGKAPNQFILHYEHGTVFQSYESLIGAKIGNDLYLTDHHDFSNTTSGHTSRWCGHYTAERRKGLANGDFIFIK